MAKYRFLTVEVKSAQFDVKKKGKFYVKVSTHKENQLKTSKIKIGTNQQWRQKFVFVVSSNESSTLRFEIFKAGNFLSRDSRVGVAKGKLDKESEEEKSAVYYTDTEYESDSDGDEEEDYPSSCLKFTVLESLKIWRSDCDKISMGKLDVEIEFGKNPSMVGDFNWKIFGMEYKDFMMDVCFMSIKTKGGYSECVCFTPAEQM